MPADIREYLLDRFRTDATTLRQRAESLRGVSRPSPGPNAALSTAMANACDNVAALAEQLPEHAPVDVMIGSLKLLVPKLMLLAGSPEATAAPAIRSVYMGACTRAQELIAAEASVATNDALGVPAELDDADGLDDFADDDDDDVDDDDLYDDDQTTDDLDEDRRK